MELYIGSNIIRNTSGVLTVHDKEIITLEIDKESGQILLNMDIYDAEGNHIAKLKRNAWSFNNKDRFDITTHPLELRLIDKETKEIVVEAKIIGTYIIEITQGEFYSQLGNRIKITPNYFSIDSGIRVNGNKFDGLGKEFEITSNDGVAIGLFHTAP